MSTAELPPYLEIPPERLGEDEPVTVRVVGDGDDLARRMAEDILAELTEAERTHSPVTLILPVGPVDQFPKLANLINEHRVDCYHAMFINMDEYLDGDDRWLPADHPLSFRGHMDRVFFNRIDPELAPPTKHRVFPDPADPEQIPRLIEERGGVDACFGGIGINGHIAFNEPPEPGEPIDTDAFAERPTRVLNLSRETKTINSVTVGGGIEVVPPRAVTVGMKEILAARKLRLYCNRPWQSAVIRRALHGPITAACPSSLMRRHPDATVTLAEYVAEKPDIRLR